MPPKIKNYFKTRCTWKYLNTSIITNKTHVLVFKNSLINSPDEHIEFDTGRFVIHLVDKTSLETCTYLSPVICMHIYVSIAGVPVNFITTITLTNLIDVHQLFAGRRPLNSLSTCQLAWFPDNFIFHDTFYR